MGASNELISRGLDQLSEGFGIFDKDLRLVSCNRIYRDLRGYPEALCRPGRSLEEMIRFNAERGDFGPGPVEELVAERMAEIAESDRREIEREMADGQILLIRYQHLDGDGLTITFQDKTAERRAQRALAASEERYALVAEAAREAIYEWHIETDQFFASPRLHEMLGVASDKTGFRDWCWEDRIHPDDRDHYRSTLEAHRSGNEPGWACEYRFRDRGGDYRWVSDHGTSIRNERGEAIRMVAALRDITDLKEAEQALAEREAQIRLALDNMPGGMMLGDQDLNYALFNAQYSALCDFPDGLIEAGGSVYDTLRFMAERGDFGPGDKDTLIDEVVAKYKSGQALTYERVIAGSGRTLEVSLSPTPEGGYVMFLTDISERKRAEQALAEKEAQFRLALDNMPGGLALGDKDFNLVLCNTQYNELCDFPDDLLKVGGPMRDELGFQAERGDFGPGDKDELVEQVLEVYQRSEALSFERVIAGTGRTVQISVAPTPEGGYIDVVTDITDRKRAEEAVRKSEQFLGTLVDNIPAVVFFRDLDGRFVRINRRYEEVYQVTDDAVRGKTLHEVFPKGQADDFTAYDREAIEQRRVFKREETAMLQGVAHVFDALKFPVLDTAGNVIAIGGVDLDITEHKRAEQELTEKEAQLRLALDNMPGGIVLCDPDLNYVIFNEHYGALCNFPDGLVKAGGSTYDVMRFQAERGDFGAGDIDSLIEDLIALHRKGEPVNYERSFVGSDRTVQIYLAPTPEGGYVSIITDITERKKAEQALADREAELTKALQEFDAVLGNIEYGILFMDQDLKARIINRAFGRIWGISQEVIDRSPSMRELIEYNKDTGLYDISPEEWEGWIESRVEAVRKGSIAPMEIRRADGTILQYQCIALPDGGRMLTYFDITELKEREAELITARDAAERTLKDLELAQERLVHAEKMASLGQLTAGIAHEMKNPLNFVNNFAELSGELLEELAEGLQAPIAALGADDREDAESLLDVVKSNLAKIGEHGRRADGIVKNMLLHSREGSGALQSASLNAIAEEALNLAYHGARAENADFTIEMEKALSEGVGEIDCFPQDLMRVFLNLISNAMYAANAGKAAAADPLSAPVPTVSVETRAEGDKVVVVVRDNGAGIPDEIREEIFNPFFTTKPAGEGTGLGLSLSYDIVVKQHGGSMTVQSEPDAGSAFIVTLPRTMAGGAGG